MGVVGPKGVNDDDALVPHKATRTTTTRTGQLNDCCRGGGGKLAANRREKIDEIHT